MHGLLGKVDVEGGQRLQHDERFTYCPRLIGIDAEFRPVPDGVTHGGNTGQITLTT